MKTIKLLQITDYSFRDELIPTSNGPVKFGQWLRDESSRFSSRKIKTKILPDKVGQVALFAYVRKS